jgi:hypothetical protein
MSESSPPANDVKDMVIAGCHVRLSYGRIAGGRWTVTATVECGIEDKTDEHSVVTQPFDSREAAEHDAFQQVTRLLGRQTDRSSSRTRNWS